MKNFIIYITLLTTCTSYSQITEMSVHLFDNTIYKILTKDVDSIKTTTTDYNIYKNGTIFYNQSISNIDSVTFMTGLKFRDSLKNKPRPLIHYNDGTDMVYSTNGTTTNDFLQSRFISGLEYPSQPGINQTQVSTIDYCTWSAGWGQFTHNTSIGDIFTTTTPALWNNNKTQDFINQGTDALQLAIDYCNSRDIEIFWNMRMNDTHDGVPAYYQNTFISPFKQANPGLLMGSGNSDASIINGRWTCVKYEESIIRDLTYQFAKEVCSNYDVDGITFDFSRSSILFSKTAHDINCGILEQDMLTDMFRKIRNMADSIGFERGRPILIAMKISDDTQYCKDMGIDLEKWLQEDLLDIWFSGNYFQLNHPSYSVNLGHQNGVKVYPSNDETRIRADLYPKSRFYRANSPTFYGRALNWLREGADGIYSFNYEQNFSHLGRLHKFGDISTLVGIDKFYVTDEARGNMKLITSYPDPENYFGYDYVDPMHTVDIATGTVKQMDIQIGDDFSVNPPVSNTLHLMFNNAPQNISNLSVDVNGTDITNTATRSTGIALNSTCGYSVEWRVKIISNVANGSSAGLSCAPETNEKWTLLTPMHGGKIYAKFYGGVNEVIIDNDASNPAFHTMRVAIENGNAYLYIDGSAAPDLIQPFLNNPKSPLLFGDLSSGNDGDFWVDYVYAYDGGAIPGNITPNWNMTYEGDIKPDFNYSTTYSTTLETTGFRYNHQQYGQIDGVTNTLRINTLGTGHDCIFMIDNKVWYDYIINSSDLNLGWNSFNFNLSNSSCIPTITLSDLSLEIDY